MSDDNSRLQFFPMYWKLNPEMSSEPTVEYKSKWVLASEHMGEISARDMKRIMLDRYAFVVSNSTSLPGPVEHMAVLYLRAQWRLYSS